MFQSHLSCLLKKQLHQQFLSNQADISALLSTVEVVDLKKFLKATSWKSDILGVFAGKIDYPKYGFFDLVSLTLFLLLFGIIHEYCT